ncbi:MAG: aminoacyl-tRNA hydrolase [Desulfobacterales bacterium]|nr:aminoacyl-tRNA hydrolase [Desulfobacterales bacterium]
MHLLVGLGNPGTQYATTRHNLGFLALDYLARCHGFAFSSSKWQAEIVKGCLWGKTVQLVKPMTFMNRSGDAVAAISRFFKIPAERILVVHDDLDLDLARIKMVARGGAGGHNGIRSLIQGLGTESFPRIKVGIGRPDQPIPAERYVLSGFSSAELKTVEERFVTLEEGLRIFLEQDVAAAMNFLNSLR